MSPFKVIIAAMSPRSKPSNGLRWFAAESVSALIIGAARSHATAPFRFLTYVPLLQGDCPPPSHGHPPEVLQCPLASPRPEPPSSDFTSLNISLRHRLSSEPLEICVLITDPCVTG